MCAKVLIIGGNGYVGSRLCDVFRNANYEIYATFFQHKSAPEFDAKNNINFLKLDVLHLSAESLLEFFKKINPDIIIFCAWCYTDNRDYIEDLKNLEWGSALKKFGSALLDYSVNSDHVIKFGVIGTCAEYGDTQELVTIDSDCIPTTLYGKVKNDSRIFLEKILGPTKIEFFWFRMFYLYAKSPPFAKLQKFCLDESINNVTLNNGNYLIDYISIEDASKEILYIMTYAGPGIFNIGSGNIDTLVNHVKRWCANRLKKINIKTDSGSDCKIIGCLDSSSLRKLHEE